MATTIVPLSVERLTSVSSHIALAQAEDSWTEWNAEHTRIYTVTRFRTEHSLKGDAGQQFLVRQIGGRNGAYEQKVAGVRQWRAGERSVLFLQKAASGDAFVVTGLMQGDFRVVREGGREVVSNGVAGVERFDAATHTVGRFSGSRMTLLELESQVRRAVQE